MKHDIADAGVVNGLAKPIKENPIAQDMKTTDAALAEFEAGVQEKSFAATLLSLALSYAFGRDWLDDDSAVRMLENDANTAHGGKVAWLKLDEIGLQPDFSPQRCAESVERLLQSLNRPSKHRVLYSFSSDGRQLRCRLGIQAICSDENHKNKLLEAAKLAADFAASNWPGLLLSATNISSAQAVFGEFATPYSSQPGWNEYAARVRVLTGLPGMRECGERRNVTTLDKLVASLQGRKWEYLVIAEPVSKTEIDRVIQICRDYAGRADSVKSFQFNAGLSSSFTKGFTQNWGRNENESSPYINWKSVGVKVAAGVALAVLCPGLLATEAGLEIATALLFSKGVIGQRSKGQNYGEGLSESIAISKTEGIGETIANKHAEAIAKLLENHAQRFEQAKALGGWDVGTYFIGDCEETADLGANVLKAVLAGDDSYREPIRVHSYPGGGVYETKKDPMSALARIENPRVVFVTKNGDNIPSHPLGERFDTLRTVLTTRELVHFVNFPITNLPGLPVRRIPADTGLADCGKGAVPSRKEHMINIGSQMFRGRILPSNGFSVSPSLLSKHALVCGINGSGKTNTILGIIGSLLDEIGAPFLVIEPAKQEYVDWAMARNAALAKKLGGPEKARMDSRWINVYVPGREKWKGADLEKLQINPFDFVWLNPDEPPKTQEHIDRLKTVINAAMPMQEILPVLMEELVYMAYGVPRAPRKAGESMPCWLPKDGSQRFPEFNEKVHLPSFNSLSVQLQHLFKSRAYAKEVQMNLRAALETRIDSFKRGWRKEMLNKDSPRHSRSEWEALFEHPTVVNLTSLTSDEDKAFFMAVLLLFVYEYRQECSELPDAPKPAPLAGKLRHLLVVEEAHRVLGKAEPASSFSANPKQKVSEMFSNMISEVRAYGQGILIADQIPCRLNEDAVKNTNLKIVHKLVSADDRAVMATALNLWEDQERVIGDLGVGEVLVRGDMDKQAVMVKVNRNV